MTQFWGVAAGVMVATAMTTAVQAQAVSAAGQVDSVFGARSSGDVILRRNGQTLAVRDYMYLQPGDTIIVTSPDVAVRIYVGGEASPRRINRANSPFRVPAAAARQPSAGAASMLASLDYLFTDRRRPIPVYTRSRGPGDPPPVVEAQPLLPAGPQLLPRSANRIALAWLGAPGDVAIEADGKTSRISNPAQNWLVLTQPGTAAFKLSVADTALGWDVRLVDDSAVPAPPWGALSQRPSDADRLARAVWLLSGPGEWRLFALSELEALSGSNFAAQRLWHAVRSGELTTVQNPQ
ncbi:MAG: hypothetical protein K1X35_01765 [Caulobacteraceae bacterium]|nr:hypothetical protein [Caulobacteraceae bacterium]